CRRPDSSRQDSRDSAQESVSRCHLVFDETNAPAPALHCIHRRCRVADSRRLRILDDRIGAARARIRRSDQDAGRPGYQWQINGSPRHRASRAVWLFFSRAPGICPAVQRQGHSRSIQSRRGRGRGQSRIDLDQQLVTRYPKRRPAPRTGSADTSRDKQVKTRVRQLAGALLLTFAFAHAGHAQRTDDPWKFTDEGEAVPTWTDDLKDQALDLTMFTAFAT